MHPCAPQHALFGRMTCSTTLRNLGIGGQRRDTRLSDKPPSLRLSEKASDSIRLSHCQCRTRCFRGWMALLQEQPQLRRLDLLQKALPLRSGADQYTTCQLPARQQLAVDQLAGAALLVVASAQAARYLALPCHSSVSEQTVHSFERVASLGSKDSCHGLNALVAEPCSPCRSSTETSERSDLGSTGKLRAAADLGSSEKQKLPPAQQLASSSWHSSSWLAGSWKDSWKLPTAVAAVARRQDALPLQALQRLQPQHSLVGASAPHSQDALGQDAIGAPAPDAPLGQVALWRQVWPEQPPYADHKPPRSLSAPSCHDLSVASWPRSPAPCCVQLRTCSCCPPCPAACGGAIGCAGSAAESACASMVSDFVLAAKIPLSDLMSDFVDCPSSHGLGAPMPSLENPNRAALATVTGAATRTSPCPCPSDNATGPCPRHSLVHLCCLSETKASSCTQPARAQCSQLCLSSSCSQSSPSPHHWASDQTSRACAQA